MTTFEKMTKAQLIERIRMLHDDHEDIRERWDKHRAELEGKLVAAMGEAKRFRQNFENAVEDVHRLELQDDNQKTELRQLRAAVTAQAVAMSAVVAIRDESIRELREAEQASRISRTHPVRPTTDFFADAMAERLTPQ
jgi:predicted nuclease with TOPRIM domain